MTQVIPSGKTIGILGGGQLAKMLITEGTARLGYKTAVWDPNEQSPAFEVTGRILTGKYDDPVTFKRFLQMVDVVTYEFENVPYSLALKLEDCGKLLRPSAAVLRTTQDRFEEKEFLKGLGIPIAPYYTFNRKPPADFVFPAIVKTRQGGYDGHGQANVISDAEARRYWEESLAPKPVVIESCIDIDYEMSVITVTGVDGKTLCYPVVRNRHENGILRETHWGGYLNVKWKEAYALAMQIVSALKPIGVLTIEMFVTKDGRVWVNELAPRVHNSGHWTIEGAVTSQFEQHIRAICGLPLGSVHVRGRGVMRNILGGEANDALKLLGGKGDIRLHLYGKGEARPGRKMGHTNQLFPD